MNKKLNPPIGIFLIVAAGIACSMLRPKRPLTWHVVLEIDSSAPDREAATRQTIAVIEKRLDAFGVSNSEVKAQGPASAGRILVNLPDVPNTERVKNVLTTGGKLELVAVISPPSPALVETYASKEEAIASLASNGAVPETRRVLLYPNRQIDSPLVKKWVVVESPAILDGSELRTASAAPSGPGSNDYDIQFSLKKTGADRFGAWTGAHVNEYLGVVLNDQVLSIAYIKGQIFDQGVISGRFTKESAGDLALVLNSGAYPAQVRFVEEGRNK